MKMKTMNKILDLQKYDFIISIGDMFLNTDLKTNADFIYMHPIENNEVKSTKYIKYEAGCEEAVLAMILEIFCNDESLKERLEEFDIGYLSAESNVGEEEIEEIYEISKDKSNFALIVSNDLFSHEKVSNIKSLLTNISKSTNFEILSNIDFLTEEEIEEIEELDTFNGSVIYSVNTKETNVLKAGSSFMRVAKVSDNDKIEISYGGESLKATFKLDDTLKGTIGLYSSENHNILNEGYPYKQVKIKKVDL